MRLRGIVVLLVEDDPDNLELMASYFDGEGARTLSASSVAAALAMTRVVRVDVVVSDLELLDGDGCSLVSQLRQREGQAELPAIAITGYSERKWLEKAISSGFTRYAVKPFSLDQLVDGSRSSAAPRRAACGRSLRWWEELRGARDRLAR